MKKLFFLYISLLATYAAVAQNVGIGTSTPTANLHVNGTFRLVDSTQGAGRILTSDSIGLASWQPPPPPPPPPPVNYPVVWICCNPWMAKNLDVDTYRNGDTIPKVTLSGDWIFLTTGAYCYYQNDSTTYAATYGKLYNWYAVNDPRGLAPEGWHIPTELEWTTLSTCLGGDTLAGGPMKELDTIHWITPNTGATNYSGFTGLPGGERSAVGPFHFIGTDGYWWSSTTYVPTAPTYNWGRLIRHNNDDLIVDVFDKRRGLSVRCLRD